MSRLQYVVKELFKLTFLFSHEKSGAAGLDLTRVEYLADENTRYSEMPCTCLTVT